MGTYETLKMTREFCTTLLEERLGENMYFHNSAHTFEVVEACYEIGTDSGLTIEDLNIVCIAAWFHDSGYCNTYENHEFESVNIATSFLNLLETDENVIKKVTGCIVATKVPQQPTVFLEKIICDADLYHFSRTNYHDYEQALRKEWEINQRLFFTDEDWNKGNYELLTKHGYFTYYGRQVLQPRKEKNIKKLHQLLK